MKQNTFLKKIVVILFLVAACVKPVSAKAFDLADASIGTPAPIASMQNISTDSLDLSSLSTQDHMKLSAFYQIPVSVDDFYGISTPFTYAHKGLDYRAKVNSDVYAIHQGIVTFVGYEASGYGKYIIIKHDNGLESLYAHLSKTEVKEGDTVETGKVIGKIGLTGRTTGPHLHFELHLEDKSLSPSGIIPEIK